ncbi:hypothetical protein ACLOJK_009139 [Asimina triloba]
MVGIPLKEAKGNTPTHKKNRRIIRTLVFRASHLTRRCISPFCVAFAERRPPSYPTTLVPSRHQSRGVVDGEMGKRRRNARTSKGDAASERTFATCPHVVAAHRHVVVSDRWLRSRKSDSQCIR